MTAVADGAVLWCWCCGVWGLTFAAVDGQKVLCAACLDSTPAGCKARHMADALTAGQQAAQKAATS